MAKDERRDRARVLYFMGLSAKQITLQVGVAQPIVRQWITRYGWAKERNVKQAEQAKLTEQTATMMIADAVLQHTDKVKTLYAQSIDRLANLEVPKPKNAREYIESIVALDTAQRRNLGLDSENPSDSRSSTFNFNLGGLEVNKKGEKPANVMPIIEAEIQQVVDDDILA